MAAGSVDYNKDNLEETTGFQPPPFSGDEQIFVCLRRAAKVEPS
jgi:hypothetical protein